MNALRLALGGVGAGMASYGRGMIDREERLKREAQQEEMNAINTLNMYRAAGGGISVLPEEEAPAQAGTFSMPQPTLPASSLSPSVMGKALASATQQSMGASERPTGTLDTPIRTALNAAPAQPPARPATPPAKGVTVGGIRFGLVPQDVVAKRAREAELEEKESTFKLEQRLKDEALNQRAKELAPFVGNDINKAKQLLSGISSDLLGIDAMSPIEKRKAEAAIAQSYASAAASRAQVAQANREYQGELDKAEAWWNESMSDPKERAEKSAEFMRLRGSKANANKPPQEIMLGMYRKSQETAKTAPKTSSSDELLRQIGLGAAIPGNAATAPTSAQALYQEALDLIKEGTAPREAVIQRYENVTKTKWPGG